MIIRNSLKIILIVFKNLISIKEKEKSKRGMKWMTLT